MNKNNDILLNPFEKLVEILNTDNVFIEFILSSTSPKRVIKINILNNYLEVIVIINNSFKDTSDAIDFLAKVRKLNL